jgi:SAM-dependent methyltransferase
VSLSARFAAQLAHPRGLAGRLLGAAMDLANERPQRLALDALGAAPGERILDFGCGTGRALSAIRTTVNCRLYGLDRSAAMIAAAQRRLGLDATLLRGELDDLPPGWGGFDAVLALNVLYFADPSGKMVAGLRQLLRRGGRLVAYVSDRQTMEPWFFTRAGFHRLFDAAELAAMLIEGGFSRPAISIKDHAVAPGIRGLVACAKR